MKPDWQQIHELYIPLGILFLSQILLLVLPVNLKSWRNDLLSSCTYCIFQVFAGGLLLLVAPEYLLDFRWSLSNGALVLLGVFLASAWRVLKTIPLEATFNEVMEFKETAELSFDYFYKPERLRLLGELSGDDVFTQGRRRALREMLVRRRVDVTNPDSDES